MRYASTTVSSRHPREGGRSMLPVGLDRIAAFSPSLELLQRRTHVGVDMFGNAGAEASAPAPGNPLAFSAASPRARLALCASPCGFHSGGGGRRRSPCFIARLTETPAASYFAVDSPGGCFFAPLWQDATHMALELCVDPCERPTLCATFEWWVERLLPLVTYVHVSLTRSPKEPVPLPLLLPRLYDWYCVRRAAAPGARPPLELAFGADCMEEVDWLRSWARAPLASLSLRWCWSLCSFEVLWAAVRHCGLRRLALESPWGMAKVAATTEGEGEGEGRGQAEEEAQGDTLVLPPDDALPPALEALALYHWALVRDVTALGRLRALRVLDLTASGVVSLAFLQALPQLESLCVAECESITDFSPLAHCRRLTAVNLSGTAIADLGVLFEVAAGLRAVSLRGCRALTDFAPLFDHVQTPLEIVDAGYTALSSLSWLARCPRLRHLLLEGCSRIVDHEGPLRGAALPQLLTLKLWGAGGLADLCCLAGCPSLRVLSMCKCGSVTDLAPLARWTPRLQKLDVSYTGVRSLAPLLSLPSLLLVTAHGCRGVGEGADLGMCLQRLRARGVEVVHSFEGSFLC